MKYFFQIHQGAKKQAWISNCIDNEYSNNERSFAVGASCCEPDSITTRKQGTHDFRWSLLDWG